MSKYTPLEKFLTYSKTYNSVLNMSFADIEKIIGEGLPESAHQNAAWWTDADQDSHCHAKAWVNAGWKVDRVNFEKQRVTFSVIALPPRVSSRF